MAELSVQWTTQQFATTCADEYLNFFYYVIMLQPVQGEN